MSYTYTIKEHCRLCGAGLDLETDKAIPLVPTPPGDKYVPSERQGEVIETVPLDIMLCPECGHVQTIAVVDPEYLYRHYLSRPAAVNVGLSGAYADYARDLLVRFSSDDGLAVELGSNDGMFSRFLMDNGIRAVGVEPARNLAEQATEAGVQTYPEFFTPDLARKIREEHGTADIVIANHMFANIDDVDSVMKGVDELLDAEGVMSLQTFYFLDVVEKMLLENYNHEHLSYFLIGPLQKFFNKHGFEIFEVQRVPAKGGSIRCFIQRGGASRSIDRSVRDAIAAEKALKLNDVATYASVTDFIARLRKDLRARLEPVHADGKQIVGYGTSIGATTFTYQYGLGDLLSCYIDDDPYRQGLISPGFELPVIGREKLDVDNLGAIVVLAPLYADQIIQKNSDLADAKIPFIKIWPEFAVV